MIERSRRYGDRDPSRMVGGIDVEGELRIPVAETASRVGKAAEIAPGAPPQRLL